MAEVVALRTLSDSEALEWLRSQPGGRTTLRPVDLAQRWGWPQYRVTRRLQKWSQDGLVTRRGNVLRTADRALEKVPLPAAKNEVQVVETETELQTSLASILAPENTAIFAPIQTANLAIATPEHLAPRLVRLRAEIRRLANEVRDETEERHLLELLGGL